MSLFIILSKTFSTNVLIMNRSFLECFDVRQFEPHQFHWWWFCNSFVALFQITYDHWRSAAYLSFILTKALEQVCIKKLKFDFYLRSIDWGLLRSFWTPYFFLEIQIPVLHRITLKAADSAYLLFMSPAGLMRVHIKKKCENCCQIRVSGAQGAN